MCARCTGGTRLSRPPPPLADPRWSTGGTRLSRPPVPPAALERGPPMLVLIY